MSRIKLPKPMPQTMPLSIICCMCCHMVWLRRGIQVAPPIGLILPWTSWQAPIPIMPIHMPALLPHPVLQRKGPSKGASEPIALMQL
jgi:hypothetical protein